MGALREVEGITVEDGNVERLFEAAEPGDFLKARISAENGKGPLFIRYNWLYSALNCVPGGPTNFYWTFSKTAAGRLTLSPSAPYAGMRLYASVRDDWNWTVQVQAPRSGDWIKSVGRDELLEVEGAGILSFVLKGFNDKFVAIDQAQTTHDRVSGYLLHSVDSVAVEDCAFQIIDPTVLQQNLSFLSNYTTTTSDIAAIVGAFDIPLDEDAARQLLQNLPQITPELLAQHGDRSLAAVTGPAGMFAGALVGALLGGAVGFAMGGPVGAVAGIALGASAGANIGMGLQVQLPFGDPPNVVNQAIPSVRDTFFNLTPVGGPYENQNYWHDLIDFTKYPQIGSDKLPNACCLYPPATDGSVQVWSPVREEVIPFITNEEEWPPIHSHATGTTLFMAIYVIVKVGEMYQFRLHPDEALINGPNRPNHSQLTICSRICGLVGGEMDQVYAAGEIYCDVDRKARGITAKTGHFWDRSASFDSNVTQTAKAALQALGYDTSGVLLGQAFWDWFQGKSK